MDIVKGSTSVQTGPSTPTVQPQSAYPYPYQLQQVAQQIMHHHSVPEDRFTVSAAAGGMAALAGVGHVEKPLVFFKKNVMKYSILTHYT